MKRSTKHKIRKNAQIIGIIIAVIIIAGIWAFYPNKAGDVNQQQEKLGITSAKAMNKLQALQKYQGL